MLYKQRDTLQKGSHQRLRMLQKNGIKIQQMPHRFNNRHLQMRQRHLSWAVRQFHESQIKPMTSKRSQSLRFKQPYSLHIYSKESIYPLFITIPRSCTALGLEKKIKRIGLYEMQKKSKLKYCYIYKVKKLILTNSFSYFLLYSKNILPNNNTFSTMLGIEKIRQVFEQQGFNPNSYIRRGEYNQFLNDLTRGEVFDEDVAGQLWQQAARGDSYAQQIKVDQICKTIEEGQNILRTRITQVEEQINALERQRQHAINSGVQRYSPQIQKIDQDLKNLYDDRAEYEDDYRLITQPFGMRPSMNVSRRSMSHSRYQSGGYESNVYPDGNNNSTQSNQDLQWVLYLSLIFGAIEIIIIYGKYDFLNLIVLTCLLSIYLLNHFDQVYIRLTLALLSISEILDVLWLFMYASQTWNPPTVGNNSSGQVGYLRFIVFFTIAIVLLKVPLGYFLFKYRNASPDTKYPVSVLGGVLKIVLSANKSNPITRGINNSIEG